MKPLRVAVIGVGIQGENHVKAYKSTPLADLVAICDVNEERLKVVGDKYGVERRYLDYREMLEELRLDLVSVATPDHLHLAPALAVVEHGVHVLVEKPLATRYEDAVRIVEAARREGVRVFTAFSNRFNPPFALLRDEVARGELGDVTYAYLRLSDTLYVPTRMLKWASNTSVVYFLMSHTADLARWILGSEVESVRAYANYGVLTSMGIGVPDYVIAVLHFRSGAIVVLESSWILPETYPSIVEFKAEFIGSRGLALIDATEQCARMSTANKFYYPRFLGASEINGRFYGFAKDLIHHVVEALAGGYEAIVSEEDGLRNVEILDAITKSYREDKCIYL